MPQDIAIRLIVFLAVLAVLAGLERIAPRRPSLQPGPWRRFANLSLGALGVLTVQLLARAVPILAVVAAVDAGALGLGLFNQLGGPWWVELVLAILFLDLAIWAQHLVTHKVPVLWRFHRVHHADRDFDVTTALRFHPAEIAASALLKVALVYLLGPSALAVLVFEILLNVTAMFSHSNLALPPPMDRLVRAILVTPDMHRVHHSADRADHDSNFGFALSVWDRIFGTYRDTPRAGLAGMTLGLEWQDDQPARLRWMLMLPFRR